MGRIRTIKPEFSQSETIGKLSRDARLLFIQLWTVVDDSGRVRGASRMLASILYPYDDDAPSLIDGWMGELEREDCIHRYEVKGAKYLEINNWIKHQKIEKPSTSRLPDRDGIIAGKKLVTTEASPKPPRSLPEPSPPPSVPAGEPSVPDLGPRTCTLDLGPRTSDQDKDLRLLDSENRGEDCAAEVGAAVDPPRKRPKRLSADWIPTPKNLTDAERWGLAQEHHKAVTEDFKAWAATSPNAVKLDWDLVWGTWIRRVVREGDYTRPRPAAPGAVVPFKARPAPRIALEIAPASDQEWSRRLNCWRQRRQWDREVWGPTPEQRACACPRHLFAAALVDLPQVMLNLGNGKAEPFDTTPAPKPPAGAPDLDLGVTP